MSRDFKNDDIRYRIISMVLRMEHILYFDKTFLSWYQLTRPRVTGTVNNKNVISNITRKLCKVQNKKVFHS